MQNGSVVLEISLVKPTTLLHALLIIWLLVQQLQLLTEYLHELRFLKGIFWP